MPQHDQQTDVFPDFDCAPPIDYDFAPNLHPGFSHGAQVNAIEKLLAARRQIIENNTGKGALLIDQRLN
jgi:hypothetical protein